jgi:hypothetical protein
LFEMLRVVCCIFLLPPLGLHGRQCGGRVAVCAAQTGLKAREQIEGMAFVGEGLEGRRSQGSRRQGVRRGPNTCDLGVNGLIQEVDFGCEYAPKAAARGGHGEA